MEAEDFFVKKSIEYLSRLPIEKIKTCVIAAHPEIIRCDIVTYQEFEDMRKSGLFGPDYASEL